MDPHAGKIVLNGAPSQYDRWLPALDPGYAPVDGRSLSELLDFSVEFAALLNFYNLRDEIDGDWVGFFASDPTMMLAALDSMDPAALERDFARLEELTRTTPAFPRKFELLGRVFAFIQALARQINDWLAALGGQPDRGVARVLWQMLADAVKTSLGEQLRRLQGYAEGAGLAGALGRPIPLDWEGFLPIWGLGHDCPDGSIYRGRSRARKIDHALPFLAPIFAAFRDGLAELQNLARANFAASLAEPDHKPQIGLYIAFARLFGTAQATINSISSRYAHFYYHDILRETPAGPVSDQVFLTFVLEADEKVRSTTVPRGTLFPAGEDAEGGDILFASERGLQVTAAQIDVTRTLRVVRGPLTAETPGTTVVRRIVGSEIALAAAAAKSIPWPMFGPSESRSSPVEVTAPATLGLAVASPYLMLTGGERKISLVVRYSEHFKKDTLDPLLDALAAIVALPPDTIFRKILDGAFTVLASSEDGWFEVPPYSAELPTGTDASFRLYFALPVTAPPIVPYDPDAAAPPADPLAAVNPAPTLPTLKLYLRQQEVTLEPPPDSGGHAVKVYPLSLLDGMPIEELRIATDVAALADVDLQSTTGPLDTSAPFPLFGAPAVLGSYLDIRRAELFAKRIDSLRLTIDWFDLPQNADGFKGYYRDYVIGLDGRKQPDLFDNSVFRVSVGVRHPGFWTIADSTPADMRNLHLFRTGPPKCDTTDPAGALCPTTEFDFAPPVIADTTPPPYYAPTDGAIRVTLTAPAYAFGEDLYAQNVLYSVLSDLPPAESCQQKCEAENAILKDAAKLIAASIDECDVQPDDTFRDCITNSLAQCVDQFLLDAAQCLWDCAAKSQASLDAEAFARVKASFESARDAPREERAHQLRQWADACRALPKFDLACLDKCLALLEAVVSIGLCQSSCASEPTGAYRGCILPCIKNCQTQLEEAYARFVEQCIADCAKPKAELNYPSAPWVPTAKRVSIGYSAGGVVVGRDPAEGMFFHLLPFGGHAQASGPGPLLPLLDDEGALYLGFTGLVPPQGLTLLFQLGAVQNAQDEDDQPPVKLEYLSRNCWTRLGTDDISADGTNGLTNSGILRLALPAYDPVGNTVLAGDRQWLRAAVASGAATFPDAIAIYPNATTARRQDAPGSGDALGRPLPPHTITSSVQPLPDIASIDQPMESFGGRPAEMRKAFEMRLGERLRHKDRAVLGWDYERLVLARFPTIWKAQTLPARGGQHGQVPGDVLVVVVAGPDSLDVIDPTVPIASAALLGAIRRYLEGLTSPFVRLHVVNPIYVRITVAAELRFSDTEDVGAAIARLNDELVRYLSPWFYDAARAAKGGRYVAEDEIEAFIVTRPDVEGLLRFAVSYDPPPNDLEWYFLTSARQHRLTEVGPAAKAQRAGY